MSDIVYRLRSWPDDERPDVMDEAADEIERLRAVIESAKNWQRGVMTEPAVDSPTVTYAAWVRKALNHLGDILVGKSAR